MVYEKSGNFVDVRSFFSSNAGLNWINGVSAGAFTLNSLIEFNDYMGLTTIGSNNFSAWCSAVSNPIIYVTKNANGCEFDIPNHDSKFNLSNSPNPFNPSTQITFSISKSNFVTIKVYNMLGQEIATLIDNEFKDKGIHTVEFNAQNLPSGVYFYKLSSGDYFKVERMLLIK
ncbi:MAG: T9SS type A sorting domain-containing protein [Chlorobi bacterium]|nr:T9SS type A sorting domain-containing protein [Chlorobiota bacterium]